LIEEYRQAGYMTELGRFTYPKFEDLGSTLTVEDVALEVGRLRVQRRVNSVRLSLSSPALDNLMILPLLM
jgi:hypothetical protein